VNKCKVVSYGRIGEILTKTISKTLNIEDHNLEMLFEIKVLGVILTHI
jgi:hypothetical protein